MSERTTYYRNRGMETNRPRPLFVIIWSGNDLFAKTSKMLDFSPETLERLDKQAGTFAEVINGLPGPAIVLGPGDSKMWCCDANFDDVAARMLEPCRRMGIPVLNPVEPYRDMLKIKGDNWHCKKCDPNLMVTGRMIGEAVNVLKYMTLLQATFDRFICTHATILLSKGIQPVKPRADRPGGPEQEVVLELPKLNEEYAKVVSVSLHDVINKRAEAEIRDEDRRLVLSEGPGAVPLMRWTRSPWRTTMLMTLRRLQRRWNCSPSPRRERVMSLIRNTSSTQP